MDSINILHLTDAHVRASSKADFQRRINALARYLEKEQEQIDVMVVTGDLTFSGKPEEFQIFHNLVIERLSKVLHLNRGSIIIVPGNHDVDRTKIPLIEFEETRKIANSKEIEEYVSDLSSDWVRLAAFNEYRSEHYKQSKEGRFLTKSLKNGLYNSHILQNIKGFRVGFGLFNSAWFCADDNDEGRLFLSKTQVSQVAESLEGCDFKIALCHHPLEWLHSSEEELTTTDLRSEFPILITGHLHKPLSEHRSTPHGNCLHLTGRALFEGKDVADVEDGFHIYKINPSERSVRALYRKYIRRRDDYDKDTDHAKDGVCEFPFLPPTEIKWGRAALIQRMDKVSTVLEEEIKRELSMVQDSETPVFVWPKIRSFRTKNGSRSTIIPSLSSEDLNREFIILTGQSDCGKSILLKTLVLQNKDSSERHDPVLLIRSETEEWSSEELIISSISRKIGISLGDVHKEKLRILVDGFWSKPIETSKMITAVARRFGWKLVLTLPSFAADIANGAEEFKDFLFAEVLPWGPSRIKDFAKQVFAETTVDFRIASKLVCKCMQAVDLPTTPTIVSLYIALFPKVGNNISSLTFLRLIEKLEQLRIGLNEVGTVCSLYNRQRILQRISKRSLEKQDYELPIDEIYSIVDDYFRPKKISTDSSEFINQIIDSGILRRDGDRISFSNFVFMDYYVALAFREGLIGIDDYTRNLVSCTKIASALSLFAGLKRENIELAETLIGLIDKECSDSGNLALVDLDKHISSLLLIEERGIDKADVVAQENIDTYIDEDEVDEEYHKQRAEVKDSRIQLIKKGVDESMGELHRQISALHVFYSVFRNLENIDGEEKVVLLDKILSYHITTNFLLIDFYFQFSGDEEFRNLAAYMLTWTGHNFMTNSLGNPTLCDSLKDLASETDNDLKELLIILLLGELGDKEASKMASKFVEKNDSRSGTEIIYLHLRKLLIEYEGKVLPERLVASFKKVFMLRQTRHSSDMSKGQVNDAFNKTVTEIKISHKQSWTDKSALEEMAKEGN